MRALESFASSTTVRAVQTSLPATREQVWSVLTDFESYPDWNPFWRLRTTSSTISPGSILLIQPVWSPAATHVPPHVDLEPIYRIPPTWVPVFVTEFEPGRAMAWAGGLPKPAGVFYVQHFFRLEDGAASTTELNHGEDFHGMGHPLFLAAQRPAYQKMYGRFNECLLAEVQRRFSER